jgi:hypothetical protein
MKKFWSLLIVTAALLVSCNNNKTASETTTDPVPAGGQEAVKDDESQKDVVKVAGRTRNRFVECGTFHRFRANQCCL